MNPHEKHSVSIISMFRLVWLHRRLTYRMIVREVVGRYRGSFLGLAWSFFNPLVMLAIYTVVFSMIFKARWSGEEQGKAMFSLVLFVGMILHGFFSECIMRTPTVILSNVNYVKKVVFPLEILPIVILGAAFFHACVSFLVLIVFHLFVYGVPSVTLIAMPIIWFPFIVFTMGVSWILASLGVFIRDVGQFATLFSTILLFVSPVLYPVSAIPEQWRWVMFCNPVAISIEQMRAVLLWGHWPNIVVVVVYSVLSLLLAWLGFLWFQKTRTGFADVL